MCIRDRIYSGATAELPAAPISVSMLTGLLKTQLGEMVNEVSAPGMAKERGIEVVEVKTATSRDFAGAVTIRVSGAEGDTEIIGTLFASGEPRIVSVDGVRFEIVPDGHLLMTKHRDRPGIVGAIGTALGKQSVNISRMVLGLAKGTGVAQAVISVDGPVEKSVLDQILKTEGIESIKHYDLG